MDSSEFDPYRSPQAANLPAPESALEQAVGPYRAADKLVGALTFLLFAHILANVAAAWSNYLQIEFFNHMAATGTIDRDEFVDNILRVTFIRLGHLILYLVTAILFFVWIHRANSNARALGARGMRFTPGWCVGWWFVPFANLVQPYRCVRETWDASQPPTPGKGPVNWKADAVGGRVVAIWWLVWIGESVFNLISREARHGGSVADWPRATWLNFAGCILGIVVSVVAMMVVRGIHNRQEMKAHAVAQAAGARPALWRFDTRRVTPRRSLAATVDVEN